MHISVDVKHFFRSFLVCNRFKFLVQLYAWQFELNLYFFRPKFLKMRKIEKTCNLSKGLLYSARCLCAPVAQLDRVPDYESATPPNKIKYLLQNDRILSAFCVFERIIFFNGMSGILWIYGLRIRSDNLKSFIVIVISQT